MKERAKADTQQRAKPRTKKAAPKAAATTTAPKKGTRRRWGRDVRPPVTNICDPKAPPKGAPTPVRGVGSRAAKTLSKLLTANGKTMGLGAWCRALGITRNALRYRLANYPVEVALSPKFTDISIEKRRQDGFWNRPRHYSQEARERMRRNIGLGKALAAARAKERKYKANGETHTLAEWSKILGVKHHTLYIRVKKPGANLDVALGTKGNLKATRNGEWAAAHPGYNEYRRKQRKSRKSVGQKNGKRRG